jgi:hypothetical protein
VLDLISVRVSHRTRAKVMVHLGLILQLELGL